MHVVVVDIPSQPIRQAAVALVGVHDGRDDILLSADDPDGAAVGFREEILCEIITAVGVEIGGIHVEDHLAEDLGVVAQASVRDGLIVQHVVQDAFIAGVRLFEMDVQFTPLRHDIRVGVRFVFAFIVALPKADAAALIPFLADNGTVNAVVSCHKHLLSVRSPERDGRPRRGGHTPFSKCMTHYDTFSGAAKMSWALRGGCGCCDSLRRRSEALRLQIPCAGSLDCGCPVRENRTAVFPQPPSTRSASRPGESVFAGAYGSIDISKDISLIFQKTFH